MKLSLNTIRFVNKHYGTAGEPAQDGVDELVRRIGAQLGAVEEVTSFGKRFERVVIAKVVSCEKHPDADKLHVCTIDDGGITPDVSRDEQGYVQVVCGAANVREGLLVAWLPPGTTVPNTHGKDPFVLEAREIRGQVSNGMLASAHELGIGDDHSGILEVDADAAPGTSFAVAYNLVGEAIIDIENKMFTHRPDCFGFLGVAREIEGIHRRSYKSPDWYVSAPEFPGVEADELRLEVRNELPELVPRFSAITMRDVTVKPSPVWLQILLTSVGVRPINNIVDYTNFFMLETGQPLHAYDYDKVVAQDPGADHATIVVRHPAKDEEVVLLGGKAVKPRQEAILIATATRSIGIGGIMGGAETEVGDTTKNIILECANFDMYSIRRTAMEHGLFTDAFTRFSKGQSPLQTLAVLAKIVDEIRQYAGGKVASGVHDDNHVPAEVLERNSINPPVKLTDEFVNARLGEKLSAEDMAGLLRNVEFDVRLNGNELTVTAPFWRTDIEIAEDLVEEIGRLYGYDHLPVELPRRSIKPAQRDADLSLKSKVRDVLSKAGANEVLTYSFVHGNLLERVGQDKEKAFELSNALSPDLQYYRLSLTPSLLERVHANIKAGYDEFALFEIGKSHVKGLNDEENVPREFNRVALVFAAEPKTAARNYRGAAFYQARTYLTNLLQAFGRDTDMNLTPLSQADFGGHFVIEQMTKPYDPKRSSVIVKDGLVMGVLGEYRQSVARALKLPAFSAGFEIFQSYLSSGVPRQYVPLSRFPKVQQDISLRVSGDITYQQLADELAAGLKELAGQDLRTDLTPLDIYQKDAAKHFTFRLTAAHYGKTLKAAEINALLDNLAARAKEKFNAERI